MALPSNSYKYVAGLKDLHDKLKALGSPRVADNILRAGSRAGAVYIKKVAQQKLDSAYPGHKRALGVEHSKHLSTRYSHVWKIGPLEKHWQLIFLEYGVPPHDINPKFKKALHLGVSSGGEDLFYSHVSHPGLPRVAFIRKAAEENPNNAAEVMKKYIWNRIQKEAK